jgi:putative hydrolase of the HAD superfamily
MFDAIEVVSFDVGGVLLFPSWERVSGTLARHGIAVPATELARADPAAKFAMDHPADMHATNNAGHGSLYFGNLLAAVGVDASAGVDAIIAGIRAENAARNLWEHLPDEVPGTLEGLRDADLRLIAVSNSDGRLRELLEHVGLLPYFELVVDSHVVGVEKPDPAIFEWALDQVSVAPGRAIHVGDFYHVDVVGARAAGMTPVLLDPAGLHRARECVRVSSLPELGDRLLAGGRAARPGPR